MQSDADTYSSGFRVEEAEGLVMTPFEKNLEVWRQLWRVVERSDFLVQARPALDYL